jgi:hypothetical protein
MRFPGAWIAAAALLACEPGPNGTLCGNSAGCGNPGKLAELQTSVAGCPGCTGGAAPTIPFSVSFGDSLVIKMDTSGLFRPDSMHWEVVLYQGSQVPAFSPDPLDTLAYHAGSIVLYPRDLHRARQVRPDADTGVFAFSIHIACRVYKQGVAFDDAGLLAGLGLDTALKKFIASPGNPLLEQGKTHFLKAPKASFQGHIEGWRDSVGRADAALAYIPGSPYSAAISMAEGRFSLDSLPYGGAFELRVLIVPSDPPSNGKVPSYILMSDSSDSEDRPFRIQPTQDSLYLPEIFP